MLTLARRAGVSVNRGVARNGPCGMQKWLRDNWWPMAKLPLEVYTRQVALVWLSSAFLCTTVALSVTEPFFFMVSCWGLQAIMARLVWYECMVPLCSSASATLSVHSPHSESNAACGMQPQL